MHAWILVIVAGVFEVVWATSMKFSEGWTRLWPSVITVSAMIVSFYLLSRAMQSLPLGIAYTVWVGVGALGAALAGWLVLGERLNWMQWMCVALIAAGILGLRVAEGSSRVQQPASRIPAT